MKRNPWRKLWLASLLTFGLGVPAIADDDNAGEPEIVSEATDPTSAQSDQIFGPETNLPLPRFVSIKASEANIRRGPSLSHRIDWIFQRRNMPVQVVAEYGHWRRVTDREGIGGWIHYSLLSGSRTVIIAQDLTPLYPRVGAVANEVARLEAGVIGRVQECERDYCRISAGGYRGWAKKDALWGVGADEIID